MFTFAIEHNISYFEDIANHCHAYMLLSQTKCSYKLYANCDIDKAESPILLDKLYKKEATTFLSVVQYELIHD